MTPPKRPRVEIDPIADEALDKLVAEMPREGWQASRKDIVSALVVYANAPMVVGLTRAFNLSRFAREKARRDEEASASG